MSRVRLTAQQSAGLISGIATTLEDIGHTELAKHLKAATEKGLDAFHVADIIRDQVLQAEEARRVEQGPTRTRKA